jgi:hypothetical protein
MTYSFILLPGSHLWFPSDIPFWQYKYLVNKYLKLEDKHFTSYFLEYIIILQLHPYVPQFLSSLPLLL